MRLFLLLFWVCLVRSQWSGQCFLPNSTIFNMIDLSIGDKFQSQDQGLCSKIDQCLFSTVLDGDNLTWIYNPPIIWLNFNTHQLRVTPESDDGVDLLTDVFKSTYNVSISWKVNITHTFDLPGELGIVGKRILFQIVNDTTMTILDADNILKNGTIQEDAFCNGCTIYKS